MLKRVLIVAALVLVQGTAAFAQQAQTPRVAKPVAPRDKAMPTSAARVTKPGVRSMINGTVVDVDGNAVPSATAQLRNLQANKIEQTTIATRTGEFTFVAEPGLPYVVEVADQTGRIIAVGDVVIPQTGEVAVALVKIPARLPVIAGIFGETAGSIISATTGMGVTAIQSSLPDPPLSPEK
jgi:hypothetical protein